MHWNVFFPPLITAFVYNVHKSRHVKVNGSYFVLHISDYFLHILNKTHIRYCSIPISFIKVHISRYTSAKTLLLFLVYFVS